MPPVPHPSDPLLADLEDTYRQAQNRLAVLIDDAMRRGLDPLRAGTADEIPGDASAAYRARQLAAVNRTLDGLEQLAKTRAPIAVAHGYTAAARAVDRVAPPRVGPGAAAKIANAATMFGTGSPKHLAAVKRFGAAAAAEAAAARTPDAAGVVAKATQAGRFGAAHAAAVDQLAGNLTDGLLAAVDRSRQRVADVFAIADALAGGLPADRSALAGGTFLGRRVDDEFRAATVRSIAEGLAAGDTRREISSSMVTRLIREGTTDALTGFVDRAGRRWPLDVYSRMAVRTTTREAMSAAAGNRMVENGIAFVEISETPDPADECLPWHGGTFPIDAVELPPYHPNCQHVATPAGVNLDDYEAAIMAELAALEG